MWHRVHIEWTSWENMPGWWTVEWECANLWKWDIGVRPSTVLLYVLLLARSRLCCLWHSLINCLSIPPARPYFIFMCEEGRKVGTGVAGSEISTPCNIIIICRKGQLTVHVQIRMLDSRRLDGLNSMVMCNNWTLWGIVLRWGTLDSAWLQK